MLFRRASREKLDWRLEPVAPSVTAVRTQDTSDAEQAEAGRRLMYERIAQGNALTEAEENARRKWRGN